MVFGMTTGTNDKTPEMDDDEPDAASGVTASPPLCD